MTNQNKISLNEENEVHMDGVKQQIQGMMLIVALTSGSVFAKDLTIKLDVLEKIHAQEASGDELYFSITEFPEKKPPRHYRIPSYPTHWMSDYLKNVKNIALWQKSYSECEKTDVLISLVEADLPPWNIDDLLGAVEFKVTCEDGKMHTQWSIPNKDNTAKIMNGDSSFSFTGDRSEYHAIFKLDESKITIKNQEE
ncbi:MAG TPA: hypothetical protein PLD88_02260, partial [Candidatus Berkiella sp.]|nr:hypothetical protein [Candidatus Berkiella sp.]